MARHGCPCRDAIHCVRINSKRTRRSQHNMRSRKVSATHTRASHARVRRGGRRVSGLKFLQIRTGLNQHLTDGRMTEPMFTLYMRLQLEMGQNGFPETGVVWTSAADVSNRLLPEWSKQKAQRTLRRLFEGKYCRSWRDAGSRGQYPIQFNRHRVPLGDTQGMLIDAWATTNYKRPAFLGDTVSDTRRTGVSDTRNATPPTTQDDNPGRQPRMITQSEYRLRLRVRPRIRC